MKKGVQQREGMKCLLGKENFLKFLKNAFKAAKKTQSQPQIKIKCHPRCICFLRIAFSIKDPFSGSQSFVC